MASTSSSVFTDDMSPCFSRSSFLVVMLLPPIAGAPARAVPRLRFPRAVIPGPFACGGCRRRGRSCLPCAPVFGGSCAGALVHFVLGVVRQAHRRTGLTALHKAGVIAYG